ncbi:GNAT family N-acetyltransferase [Candidatus Uabimicrobium amorphum]|uniref:N-acetyltransferase n=1 Tax=Uabimicrobium amorphum TaxID=2596890 RepID=A0A5S9F361_UABAM|nr:GNAT family N-acetyltransferase [Candidatus Uabimicrobium amorphum]BBM84182.1 N-acetyltransferase [Candidatus Uabimicrobium amorphum]
MEIRKLQKNDKDQFSLLMKKFYQYAGEPCPTDDKLQILLEKALNKEVNFVFLGAFLANELVGIISITFAESSYKVSRFAWCDDLYVEESHRGKEIGTKLMQQAVVIAKKNHCASIMLGVGEKETNSQTFYKKLGFVDMKCKLMSCEL